MSTDIEVNGAAQHPRPIGRLSGMQPHQQPQQQPGGFHDAPRIPPQPSQFSPMNSASPYQGEENRGREREREGDGSEQPASDGGEGDGQAAQSSGTGRKRRRSRKGLEKRFECPHPGCGKFYSRAEHLYRHQLNRKGSSFDLNDVGHRKASGGGGACSPNRHGSQKK